MDILEVLTDADTGLGVSEIARRAGLPKSTAARHLAELTELGLAARASNQYHQGPRLLNLIRRNGRGPARLRRIPIPTMMGRHDATGPGHRFRHPQPRPGPLPTSPVRA
jgi:DNA-binding IclR family transcriptional regulator